MSFIEYSIDGLKNLFKHATRPDYHEPEVQKDIIKLINQGEKFDMPIYMLLREVDYNDPYLMDGYAYRSQKRNDRQRKKAVFKPVGPSDVYKFPVTSSMDIGWWIDDPALKNETWYMARNRNRQ